MTKRKKIQLTLEGFKELEKELEYRKTVKKKELSNSLGEATAKGDLSENDEYNIVLEDSLANEGRISELTNMIKNAEIITGKKNNKKVELGNTVKVKDDKNTEKAYYIVGETEANPSKQKISSTSPLGKGIIGKSVGDVVKILTPRGEIVYTIVSIS